MDVQPYADRLRSAGTTRAGSPFSGHITPGVDVVRGGREEPFLRAMPTLSSASVRWSGLALNNYTVPAVLIERHEHPDNFLHIVLRGMVRYEVNTKGRNLRFTSRPGTIFLLPRGTVDEVNWLGETQRIAVAIHPRLLTGALEDVTGGREIELTEHWDLIDKHISALVMELTADLEDNTPAGPIYGESLANALAVYLVKRYAARPLALPIYKGGLPPYRLKLVLDFISDSLKDNLSLSQLAAVAGMSPHYFSQLFKQSTGHTPHNYVLIQRIERAKRQLRDPRNNIIDASIDAGFSNPSHFARVFRTFVGTAPSKFRADYVAVGHLESCISEVLIERWNEGTRIRNGKRACRQLSGAKGRSGQCETVQSLRSLFVEGEGCGTPPPNSRDASAASRSQFYCRSSAVRKS